MTNNTETNETNSNTSNRDPFDSDHDVRNLRLEKHPSGWMKLTQDTELTLVLDAILDSPTGEQFKRDVISRQSGVTGETLTEKMGMLEDIGVIRYCDDSEDEWYEIVPMDSNPVVRVLSKLNGIMNKHYSEDNKSYGHSVEPNKDNEGY